MVNIYDFVTTRNLGLGDVLKMSLKTQKTSLLKQMVYSDVLFCDVQTSQ